MKIPKIQCSSVSIATINVLPNKQILFTSNIQENLLIQITRNLTMAISPNETFLQIKKLLYHSNLHFHLSETPFSAQIMIRKRFLKGTEGPSPSANDVHIDENHIVNTKFQEIEKIIVDSRETIELLEEKIAKAEAKALHIYDEKKTEVTILENSVKRSDCEITKIKKELNAKNKEICEKVKCIQKLEHKIENLVSTNKNLKTELNQVKAAK